MKDDAADSHLLRLLLLLLLAKCTYAATVLPVLALKGSTPASKLKYSFGGDLLFFSTKLANVNFVVKLLKDRQFLMAKSSKKHKNWTYVYK